MKKMEMKRFAKRVVASLLLNGIILEHSGEYGLSEDEEKRLMHEIGQIARDLNNKSGRITPPPRTLSECVAEFKK